MICVRIVEFLQQGDPVVDREEIPSTTAQRLHSGTSVGKIVDQTERIVAAGKAEAAHHFGDLMCNNTLKIKCSGGDWTGERERVSHTEGGAPIIPHIINNMAERFGLRSRQLPSSGAIGGIGGGHGTPRTDGDGIVLRRCECADLMEKI